MNDEADPSAEEYCQSYVGDGVRLDILTRRRADGGWELAVCNEASISTNWLETFASREAALAAALKAIEEEGVEDFSSTEGFYYLRDDYIEGEP